jgi:hypothetical protein
MVSNTPGRPRHRPSSLRVQHKARDTVADVSFEEGLCNLCLQRWRSVS